MLWRVLVAVVVLVGGCGEDEGSQEPAPVVVEVEMCSAGGVADAILEVRGEVLGCPNIEALDCMVCFNEDRAVLVERIPSDGCTYRIGVPFDDNGEDLCPSGDAVD